MKLFIELHVDEVEKSLKFYRDAIGMNVVRSSPGYTELHLGEAKISLCPFSNLNKGHYLQEVPNDRFGNRVEFCLEVENLEELYERVKEHGIAIKESLGVRPWGRTDFRIIDPNGVYLRITSPAP
jgi:catechol 2,3-dioxygenase-like lactoylglutathione lyase family enzyme